MSFLEMCQARFDKVKTVLCAGLDPVIEKFPSKYQTGDIESDISGYFCELLKEAGDRFFVIKPNIAFYEQYGFAGLRALHKIIDTSRECSIPVILDAKRGDIGNTAKAYAKAVFDDMHADAVTLSPYLGTDSLEPFFEYKDKGFFVLCRTSNKGSADFQLQTIGDKHLFQVVGEYITKWQTAYAAAIGAVVGATHIEELTTIAGLFSNNGYPPLLIPGVGTQGGDLPTVLAALNAVNYPLYKVFVNSSSKLTYSHGGRADYVQAVIEQADKFIIS